MTTRGVHVALLLRLLIIKHVKTDGKLDIRFISYRSDGTKITGDCCDNGFTTRCPDKCDPMFLLCIDGPDGGKPCSLYKSITDYTDNHNIIHFGSSIQGTPNPFVMHAPKAVPSAIMIRVEVYDYDVTPSYDHMDTLSKLINIQAAATEQSAMYTSYTLRSRTELKIWVRAYCDPYWFGSACEKYCKSTTEHSHYTCHPDTGAKVCLEGRRCENITTQCAREPCLNGGTCDGNQQAFSCACSVEWTGETCAEKVNFCDSAPCNRGDCTPDILTATGFKCKCDFGWIGDRCSLSVDIINITLLGEIDHTNRGDLADGLNRLITELGEIPRKVDVRFTTNSRRENNYITTYVHLYSAVENGSFLESIFESNPDEVINEYLPLPLYPAREEKSPHGSWDTTQYVSAILPPVGLVLMSVLLMVAFCIWRRRSCDKTEQSRDNHLLSAFVMDAPRTRKPQAPGTVTGILQDASVSPEGYTSLRFRRTDDESLHTHPATEDMTLDPVSPQSAGPNDTLRHGDEAPLDTHCADTSNIHLPPEDMTKDRMILHGLGVSPDDNARLDDVATLQSVTEGLTFDPVILQGARASPHDNARHGDVATVTPHRHVTSYIQPVTEDMTLDQGSQENEEDETEYTAIDDNAVEDI